MSQVFWTTLARKCAFVGMEGLHGHIFIVWIPEKWRLFCSHDVQFREEMKQFLREVSDGLKEEEKWETYHTIIPKALKDQSEEAEASTQPAAQRYNTPKSINELVDHENESDSETWYSADIDPEELDQYDELAERQDIIA
jgi:hypothetical protein